MSWKSVISSSSGSGINANPPISVSPAWANQLSLIQAAGVNHNVGRRGRSSTRLGVAVFSSGCFLELEALSTCWDRSADGGDNALSSRTWVVVVIRFSFLGLLL